MSDSMVTVGRIRAAIEGLPDTAPVRLTAHIDEWLVEDDDIAVSLVDVRAASVGTDFAHLLIDVAVEEVDDIFEDEDDEVE